MDNVKQAVSLEHAAWITWEIQVRNASMARALDIPLHQLLWERPRFLRYPVLAVRTFRVIRQNQIKTLFVQNPSIILSLFAVTLKGLIRLTVVVDAHNGGLYPRSGQSVLMNWLAKQVCKKADCVIVTNTALAETVRNWGGKPFVVTDPLPDFSSYQGKEIARRKPYVLFVCTWSDDEPYDEVMKAAKEISPDVDIYITGNYRKRLTTSALLQLPSNIRLLGWVSKAEYISYFRNAEAILDLTTRDHCLVCGAYEALSLGRPAIISDTAINRKVFPNGFVYTKNDAKGIASAIGTAIENRKVLELGILRTAAVHKRKGDEVNRRLKRYVVDLAFADEPTRQSVASVD